MTKAREILWPDERIAQAFMQVTDEEGQITGHEVMFVIKGIVSEYEAKIDELKEKIKKSDDYYFSSLDDCW